MYVVWLANCRGEVKNYNICYAHSKFFCFYNNRMMSWQFYDDIQRFTSYHVDRQRSEHTNGLYWQPLLHYSVSPTKVLWYFFPNGWEFLVLTRLLHVPIYATIQIFIQLPATLTKLCHIKHDHPVQFTSYAQNVHHRPKRMLGGHT